MTDVVLGVVDAIVAAATAGIGNRLLGISQIARAAGGSGVRTGVRGALQSIQRRLAGMLARMGSIGPLAQRVQASRLLQSMARGPWYKKLAAHAIAESVENAVGAFPTAVVATVIDDRNWQGGFQFGNALASIGTQVGMGVGMGLAMSGGMAGAGHLLAGARRFIRGPRLGSDLHFSTPDLLPTNDTQYRAALESYLGGRHPDGTPRTQADFDLALQRERQRHLDDFLAANPGRTEADFNARLQSEAQARRAEFEEMHRGRPEQDFDVEAGREAGEQIRKIDQQRRERQQYAEEIAMAAPEGRRGDLAEVPLSVLSDAEFTRITGKFSGDSAVVVRDGQVHLVVRQGAEPASVRQQAAHLAEITAPGTRGRVKDPAAALPTDLRGRVNVEVNPDLPARSVQVHYESHNGIIVGVWMEVGPGARAVDIQMHANTVRSMRRLQGISGRIRRLIERMRRWARLNPSPPPGTRAFEARLEMEKLPAIISERANALRNAVTPEEQVRLMMEVEHLQAQMESHARFVDAVETEPGIGYVAAEDLSKRQIDNRLEQIDDPQARSILSGLEYEEQKQFLHYFDLVNEVTAGHASPRQVTDALNSLLDTWRSLRAVADEINDTLVPRLMNKALNADDKAGFLQNTRRIVEALGAVDSQQIIRDIGYMVDTGASKGRVEDFVASANRLLDAKLPRDVSVSLLQSAAGVPDRVRLLDGIHRLTELTDDPAVLRAIAERLNGGNGRSPMSPENRADFVEGTARMIDAVERLANDYPQYRDLLPGFMQGAVETHLTGKYFQTVDDFLTTVRNYTESKNARSVRDIAARLDSSRFDPDIASIIDEAMAGPAADHPAMAGKRSVADLLDVIGATEADRELGAIARTLDILTTRSIGDPDLGVRVRPAIEDITRMLADMDMQTLPPHLQAKMRQIMDHVREFNKSVSNIDTIFPGERRISQELYDELRGKTPSREIRDRVNRDEHGNPLVPPPYPDPVLPGMTVEGALHADHIVSMDTIARMEGFERLTTEQKLSILNDERNFVGLSESANTSKGPKSFAEWTEHKASGTPVDPEFRARMMREEARLRRILQERIDELVALNNS